MRIGYILVALLALSALTSAQTSRDAVPSSAGSTKPAVEPTGNPSQAPSLAVCRKHLRKMRELAGPYGLGTDELEGKTEEELSSLAAKANICVRNHTALSTADLRARLRGYPSKPPDAE